MALPSVFDRVVAALFGSTASGPDDESEQQLIEETIEMIVDTVEPRVRLHARYRDKLKGCVRATIAYLRALGRQPLEPILLTRKAWSDDPRVNAFFAKPDDVPTCLGRSRELRAFFEDPANADVEEAFALLGMTKEEHTRFAPKLEGDILRHDVAQVAVNFSEHRLLAPSRTQVDARMEIGRRIIRQLALVALARIVALDRKANALQQHKAYLGARMRLLNLARDGMEGIVKDPATVNEQIKAVERELKDTVDDYIDAKSSLATLDGYIEQIDAVFAHPEQHLSLTHTPLRVNRMGIKVDEASPDIANELTLAELAIGENLRGAIAMARCPRSELPPKEDLVAKAERYL